MRAPIFLFLIICASILIATIVQSSPILNNNNNNDNDNDEDQNNRNFIMGLENINNMRVDPETVNYLLPKLAAKYRLNNNDWRGVNDPKFYILTEMESNYLDNNNQIDDEGLKSIRNKRHDYKVPFSVNSPINTLRMLLERDNYDEKASQNRKILNQG